MPWFALRATQVEYELTPGNRLTVHHHSLLVDVGAASWVSPHCFFDTGAVLSVVSRTVAQSVGAAFIPIPVRHGPIPRFENGVPVQPAAPDSLLGWWDSIAQQLVPCVLAEMTVQFRNRQTGVVSDPLQLVAKVLQAPAQPFGDRFVLLGTHLLTANGGQLHLASQPWGLGGPGLFFPP
jgi:hypothetical protein